jgi:hypothetical protein
MTIKEKLKKNKRKELGPSAKCRISKVGSLNTKKEMYRKHRNILSLSLSLYSNYMKGSQSRKTEIKQEKIFP